MTSQGSFWDGVRPYGGQPPSAPTDTSRAAADDMDPKLGEWQTRVLCALFLMPGTDEQLEARLDCERTRTSRPRRRELELAGYVRDSGARETGWAGKQQIVWELTAKGRAKAETLLART